MNEDIGKIIIESQWKIEKVIILIEKLINNESFNQKEMDEAGYLAMTRVNKYHDEEVITLPDKKKNR